MDASDVAAELATVLRGLEVYAEDARFAACWLAALYGAPGAQPPVRVRPLGDLLSWVLPGRDAAKLAGTAEYLAERLYPRAPHVASAACRSLWALRLLADRIELGRAAGARAERNAGG